MARGHGHQLAVLPSLAALRGVLKPFKCEPLHREEIISRCRAKVARRSIPPPTAVEIDHGVPAFLEQLEDALRARLPSSESARTALQQGEELLHQGFTVSDVAPLSRRLSGHHRACSGTEQGNPHRRFRMLNLCLDDAIAGAVTEFGRQQNQFALEGEKARGNERAGFLAHEMRNLLNTAIVAFEVLKTGNVAIGGSTGAVLHRSLMGARALTSRSLVEVRLTHGFRIPSNSSRQDSSKNWIHIAQARLAPPDSASAGV